MRGCVRYGVGSAFDSVVGENLLNFAEAADNNPEFARAAAALRLPG